MRVLHEDLHDDADDAEDHDVKMGRTRDEQCDRLAHRAQVGAEVDHVGDEEQDHDHAGKARRVVAPQIAGDAMVGRAPDPRR